MNTKIRIAVSAALAAFALPASADLAISAHDSKVYLDNGATKVYANPIGDYVSIIDLAVSPPKIVAEVKAPTSIVGPPLSVAITRDESLALVTSATKIDPADATKTAVNNVLSVIDLKASPPKVIATLEAGAGASGVSINAQGTLALVANRNEGTVSVFTIDGKTVTPAGKVKLGDDKSGPCVAVFTPDGKRALVTRDGDHTLSILNIDGAKVEDGKRNFGASYRPYGAAISSDGHYAVVANVGRGEGDVDIVSLVDMSASPPRVVDSVATASNLEGIMLSPDGRIAAVVSHEGSNKGKSFPYYHATGKVTLLRVDGGKLTRFAEAPIGGWSQGVAFSRDGRTILVQNVNEKEIQVLRLDGDKLTDTGQRIKVNAAPVAIRTSW